MPKLNLKTADERAAEIRAESAAIEAAQEAKAAEKEAEIAAEVAVKPEAPQPSREHVDYKALAKMEEDRAAAIKKQVDALQLELDPSLRPEMRTETKPYVKLDDVINHPERSAAETLAAIHDAIRKGREEAANAQPTREFPSDLSHLTPQQRERTLREMEGGRAASERAAAAANKNRELQREQDKRVAIQHAELAALKEKLAEAERTIAVLRHNPVNGQEQFPTTPASKVSVAAA